MEEQQKKREELGNEIAQLLAEIGVIEFTMNVENRNVKILFDDREFDQTLVENVTEDIKLITEQL